MDGVFDNDPELDNKAIIYDNLTYQEILDNKLAVMDLTAITLCEENNMPIRVFNGTIKGNIKNALIGENIGTYIGEK